MGEILAWLGDHWWLGFIALPMLGGAVSGMAKWMSKESKARHQRRLELIQARSQAKTAELAARAQAKALASRRTGDEPIEELDRQGRAERLQRLLDTHDDVTRRWLDYELDVAKLIAFPTMSDGRQPLTAAFLRAKVAADALRPASAQARIDAQTFAEYRDAVHDFEVAFDVAEQDARRVRDSGFTDAERKRLERARQLLQVAVDTSATAAERQVAYKRVREELDGLIALSDDAIEVLESKVAPELGR